MCTFLLFNGYYYIEALRKHLSKKGEITAMNNKNMEASVEAYAKRVGANLAELPVYDNTELIDAVDARITQWLMDKNIIADDYSDIGFMFSGACFVNGELVLLANRYEPVVLFGAINKKTNKVITLPLSTWLKFDTFAEFYSFLTDSFEGVV